MPRVHPLEPPYGPQVAEQLARMMPVDLEPIGLFRTFAINLPMAEAMTTWGSYELSRRLSLGLRDREILIDRTCVRCDCEYEFGVHAAYFADRAGLDREQGASLVAGTEGDGCWSHRDRVLIRLADSLHDRADLDDGLWSDLRAEFEEREILDAIMICGWYHAIAFAANALRVEPEEWAPRFGDFEASLDG
ncbi:MAG: carboxymuconolactone decarboxylase [Marmoricola sp.]|nr:carboxymuconolactone decarboxylase [Marmoricola sp.]